MEKIQPIAEKYNITNVYLGTDDAEVFHPPLPYSTLLTCLLHLSDFNTLLLSPFSLSFSLFALPFPLPLPLSPSPPLPATPLPLSHSPPLSPSPPLPLCPSQCSQQQQVVKLTQNYTNYKFYYILTVTANESANSIFYHLPFFCPPSPSPLLPLSPSPPLFLHFFSFLLSFFLDSSMFIFYKIFENSS